MGVSVAIGYVIYRKYLLEIRTRGEKYAEIRVQIRRLLADLLTTPDEDLIRQLHRTTRHIEQVLKRYDPDAADLGGKLKSQMGVKHRPVCMRVSSRETLTPTQSAQEALDTEPGVEPPSGAGGNYRISSAATTHSMPASAHLVVLPRLILCQRLGRTSWCFSNSLRNSS